MADLTWEPVVITAAVSPRSAAVGELVRLSVLATDVLVEETESVALSGEFKAGEV